MSQLLQKNIIGEEILQLITQFIVRIIQVHVIKMLHVLKDILDYFVNNVTKLKITIKLETLNAVYVKLNGKLSVP